MEEGQDLRQSQWFGGGWSKRNGCSFQEREDNDGWRTVAQKIDELAIGDSGSEKLPLHNSITFILDVEFEMSGHYM
jgi:hypothetical protein